MADRELGPVGKVETAETVEAAWARLRRHLDWANRFWFGVVLTVDVTAARTLRERTEFNRRRRMAPTLVLTPRTPQELADVIERLDDAPGPGGCTWVEAIHVSDLGADRSGADAVGWDEAWTLLLQRLNHRRNALRRSLGGLVLVARPELRETAQTVSTDLWSVLDFLALVEGQRGARDRPAPVTPDPPRESNTREPIVREPSIRAAVPLSLEGERTAEQHDRLITLLALSPEQVAGREAGRVAEAIEDATRAGDVSAATALLLARAHARRQARDAAGARDDFSIVAERSSDDTARLDAALALFELADEAGSLEEAERSAQQAVRIAENRPSLGDRERARALRALGDARIRLGDWARAEDVYTRSLTIREELAERVGGPQELRDVSVSLNNVGKVRQARGDWAGAEDVYTRSLTIREGLVERVGGPQELRDVSVSLDNVGQVRQARGDWAGAEDVYTRAEEIWRSLVESGVVEAGDTDYLPGFVSRRDHARRMLDDTRSRPGSAEHDG